MASTLEVVVRAGQARRVVRAQAPARRLQEISMVCVRHIVAPFVYEFLCNFSCPQLRVVAGCHVVLSTLLVFCLCQDAFVCG